MVSQSSLNLDFMKFDSFILNSAKRADDKPLQRNQAEFQFFERFSSLADTNSGPTLAKYRRESLSRRY